jgi:hypothetical protein
VLALYQPHFSAEEIMKINYLIGLVSCVVMLALPGCGSNSTPSPVVTQPTLSTITGLATKGPIGGATVNVFAIRSGVTDTVPLGQATTNAEGNYTVETFDYTGPVVVEVTGGTYKDEISHASVTLKAPLRAMSFIAPTGGGATMTIVVTPLTELAVNKAMGSPALTNAVIDASNAFVANYFGISDIVTILPSNLAGATDSQKKYISTLGEISQLVIDSKQPDGWAPGQTMDDALTAVMSRLGGELQQAGVFSDPTVSAIDRAKLLFSDGVGTTSPPSIIPPPPIPAGGVLKIGTTGIPAPVSTMTQINVTLVLPPGITVDTAVPGNVTLSGVAAAGAKGVITATFAAGTGTTPGTVAMSVQNTPFGVGEFATIKFKILDPSLTVPPNTFPTPADFSFTGFSATLHAGVIVGGITAAPLSLVGI